MPEEYSTVAASVQDAKVAYLTNDHLGSPRINTDQNGLVTARHDYHPFGEEISTGQRSAGLGYADDTVRKRFTGYERDSETELDFAQARYHNHILGRFMSADPLAASANSVHPQSWNRYCYVFNNPFRFVDPSGMIAADYYGEDGKLVGSDGNNADKNNYVLKGDAKRNKNTELKPSAAIATLPSLEIRTAIGKMADRSQNATKYYKGKEASKNDPYGNFHEESLTVGTSSDGNQQIINSAPGAVSISESATAPFRTASNPSEQTALDSLWANGQVEILAHSHPEGGQYPPPKPGSIMSDGVIVEAGQPPSAKDILGAGSGRVNIVTSSRENSVYFYDKTGTTATFPLDKFRKIGR